MIGRPPSAVFRRSVALAAVVGFAVFASGAGGELNRIDISRSGASGSSPRIASDGAGTIVAVWRELDDGAASVRAAVRPAGGSWAPSQRISTPAAATESPKLAMDRLGNAIAVWQRSSGADSVVQAAIRPARGAWSAPQDLSSPGDVAFGASVAIRAGKVTAVWMVLRDRRTAVQSSARTIAGSWSVPQTVSGPVGNASTPVVAVDDQGGAVAAWRWSDGAFLVVQAAARPTGGVWSAPETLSGPGRSASQPLVAMDASGNAVAAWLRFNGSWTAAQVASRPAGKAWEEAQNLSERGGNARGLDLTMNARGDAAVTWGQTKLSVPDDLWSALRPAGSGRWTRALVTEGWRGLEARVALDERGNATAVWSGYYLASASFKPVGEAWQDDYLLSDYDFLAAQPAVTTPTPENATAVWVRTGKAEDYVQAVSYDVNTYKEEQDEEEGGDDEGDGDEEEEEEATSSTGETIRGTPGPDRLVGTPGDDVFYGYGGDDVIEGRGGRDVVHGGPGRDVLRGGLGADRIFGEDGNDRIAAGRGRDLVLGGLGADLVLGQGGADVLYGGAGGDVLDGGVADDTVSGGRGDDRVVGGRGKDRLFGGAGRDRIAAGRGSDVVKGGIGRDVLSGGHGNDVVLGRDGAHDLVLGGTGLDLYSLDRWLDRARSIESRV